MWNRKKDGKEKKWLLMACGALLVVMVVLFALLSKDKDEHPLEILFPEEEPTEEAGPDIVTTPEGERDVSRTDEQEDIWKGLQLFRYGDAVTGVMFKYPKLYKDNYLIKEKQSEGAGDDPAMKDLAVYYIDDELQQNVLLMSMYMFKEGEVDQEKAERPEVVAVHTSENGYVYVLNYHEHVLEDIYGEHYEFYEDVRQIVKDSRSMVETFEVDREVILQKKAS